MNEHLVIPGRYCGPPGSGNGGYVAGSLAHHLVGAALAGRAVTVSLRQPPPLDASMQVSGDGERAQLSFGGAVIAEAAVVPAEIDPVEPVSYADAQTASGAYPGFSFHPFPTCFACGTDRPDGLRIFPGPVEPAPAEPADSVDAGTRVAAPWTPDESIAADYHEYADPAPRACLAATWSALDCAGGWAGDFGDRMVVLAQMTAVVDELPVIGEPHVVMGQVLGREGRRTMAATTLHDADGRIVGRARQAWVAVDPARFSSPVAR